MKLSQYINSDKVKQLGQSVGTGPLSIELSPMCWAWLIACYDTINDNRWIIHESIDGYEDEILGQIIPQMYSFIGEDMKIALVYDEKLAGTDGGTFTSGAWRQRDLNSKVDADNLVSVSANNITILTAGKYWITASAPSLGVRVAIARLTVNGNQVAVGTASYDYTASYSVVRSQVEYVGTLNTGDILRLEHICHTTVGTYGFGIGQSTIAPSSVNPIYSTVRLIKISS